MNINIYLFTYSNQCQQKHALLFSYIYLGIGSRTGQGGDINVITSFFNCSGLIRLHNIPGTDLSQMLQHLISYQCCPLEILLMLEGLEDSLTLFLFLPLFVLLVLYAAALPQLMLHFIFQINVFSLKSCIKTVIDSTIFHCFQKVSILHTSISRIERGTDITISFIMVRILN